MKKRICFLLALSVILLAGCGNNTISTNVKEREYIEYGFTTNDIEKTEMTVVAENNNLVLSINNDTTDIEVLDKRTGHIWKSAGFGERGDNTSPIRFTYLDASGAVANMNAMNDSVSKGQYKIEKIENGIHIVYSFGDVVKDLIYPYYISAERFSEFTSKMSPRLATSIETLYRHLAPGLFSDEQYEEFLKDFPKARDKDVYVLRSQDMLMNAKKELSAAFTEAGYTKEELAKDNAEFDIKGDISLSTSYQFNVGVEYILENEDLIVKLPSEEIFCSENSTGIETLSLLPSFGSPKNTDEGYFLLPDGSGSVMEFYNGFERAEQPIFVKIYGENLSKTASEKIYNLNNAVFPIMGTKVNNSAMFAVIENGDAISTVNALSGTNTLPARAWIDFAILDTQLIYPKSLTSAGDLAKDSQTAEQPQPYTGDIKVRYHFLNDSNADYSGMARYYRNYLFGDKTNKVSQVPLYLELVSAVDYTKMQSGFSRHIVSTLTDFNDVERINEDLYKKGIKRQKVILSGWQKTGWNSGYADKMVVSKSAGGKKGFKNLIEALKKNGTEFFPEVDVQFVYDSAISGSVKKNLTSRTIVQQLTRLYSYKLSDFQSDKQLAYGMNLNYTVSSIEKTSEFLNDFGVNSLSFRNIGKYIIPDYKEDSVIDLQETLDGTVNAVEKLADSGVKIISRQGNVPVAKHTSDILELPIYSTRNIMSAYEIPFTAMVYSGNIEFCSKPLNLSGTSKKDLLKLIESGSGVYFLLTDEKDDNVKNSDFNRLYSTKYDDIKNSVVETYNTINTALSDIYGSFIYSHERVAQNVYKTTYENGKYIIANYNEFEVNINGVNIEGNGFVKGGE